MALVTTHGPHLVWYIHYKTAVLLLSAHLAGITQSSTIYSQQVQVDNKKASLNPETCIITTATGMPRVCTLPPPF